MRKYIVFIYVFIAFIDSLPILTKPRSAPLLLLISLDGFRWDYPDIYQLTHLNSIMQRGVRVKHIDNSFATVTFPSHFTIVTGLYEETHGIVANEIYDPVLEEIATIPTMNHTKWWSQNSYSQPIWISNQLANDSLERRSGVIAWPGSTTPINGHLASKYEAYDSNRSFNSTLQQVLNWFRESAEKRINFGAIYHFQPDVDGHEYGPISPEMNRTLRKLDDNIGEFLKIIDNDDYLKTNLNVIITSDHGMHEIDQKHRIKLEDYIDKSLFNAYGGRTFANIFVKNVKDIDRIYTNLSSVPNYEVYKKAQIPTEYHYTNNVRIGDILIIGKVGYEIFRPGDNTSSNHLGEHGYDNRVESMHPIFYAFGPVFRSNLFAEPFRNVDIYPLMSYILHLQPRLTNGSLDYVKHILRDFQPDIYSKIIVTSCLSLFIITAVIFTICACRHARTLIYVPVENRPVQYRLLSMDESSTNNFIASDDEDETEDQKL